MDPIRKYIIQQIIKQTGKIPRATTLIDNAVAKLKIRLKDAGQDISKFTDPKQITQFFNKEKSLWNQNIKRAADAASKNILKGTQKKPFSGWTPKVIKGSMKADDYAALKKEYFRRVMTSSDDSINNFLKKGLDKADKRFLNFSKAQRKDFLDMFDYRIKHGNKKFMNDFTDAAGKFKLPENLAYGGVAGLLGERTGFQTGGSPAIDPRMQQTYAQNVAANEAQRAANYAARFVNQPSILGPAAQQAAKNKLEGIQKSDAALNMLNQTSMSPTGTGDTGIMTQAPTTGPTMADVAGPDTSSLYRPGFKDERMSGGPSRDQLFTDVIPDFDKYGNYIGTDPFMKEYAGAGRGTSSAQLVRLPANHPYAEGQGEGYYEYDGTSFTKVGSNQYYPMTAEKELDFLRSQYLPSGMNQTTVPRKITQDDIDTFNFTKSDPMMTGFDYSAQQPFSWSPGQAAPEGYRVVNMRGDQFLERMYPSKEEIGGMPMGPMVSMPDGSYRPMLPHMMAQMPDPYEGLSGQEYAEKYGIPYNQGGRVGLNKGGLAPLLGEPTYVDDNHRVPYKDGKTGFSGTFDEWRAQNPSREELLSQDPSKNIGDYIQLIPQYDEKGNLIPIFRKTGKQPIKGAPDGITSDKEFFNLIVGLDIPIEEKWSILGDIGFSKYRNKIEKDGQEIFLVDPGSNVNKNIGIGYDDNGLSGSFMYNPNTKHKQFQISKKFRFLNNEGGRVPLKDGKFLKKYKGSDLEAIINSPEINSALLGYWGIQELLTLMGFEKGGRVGLQGGGIPGALLAAIRFLMQKYGPNIIKRAKDVKPSKKWDTQKAIQEFKKRNPEFKAEGGIIGLNAGGPLNTQALIELYMAEGMSQEEAEAAANASANLPWNILTEKAEGGRVPMWMGGGLGAGKALLREMLKYFSKASTHGKSPTEILKMLNPKRFNEMLSKSGSIPEFVKDMIKKEVKTIKKGRADTIEEVITSAKNIKKADDVVIAHKKWMVEDMVKKGSDRKTAEMFADGLSKTMARNVTGKDTPKITERGLLELENIHKNLITKGRPLNAKGGLARMLGE